jgi:segregation and condensation protein B
MHDINNIIESLLFVAEEPLTLDKLKSILETIEAKEIKTALQALADQYESRGGGFKLYEVAGGWQLRSRPEYNEWIKRMLQPSPQRLSKPALETLAIVAYNQPIIRADIEHIRGVDCGGVLRQLMERKLIRVLGRKEIPGRPLIYATTRLFLELFGLKDLKDLPSPKEIEEMATAIEETSQESLPGTEEVHAPQGYRGSGLNGIGDHNLWIDPTAASKEVQYRALPAETVAAGTSIWATFRHVQASALHLKPRPPIGPPPPKIISHPPKMPAGSKNNINWCP